MENVRNGLGRWAIIAGATLLAAGCGGGDGGNAADVNALDANIMLDEPGNDASALESIANAPEPAPANGNETGNASDGGDAGDVLGDRKGGDTGGNVIEANATGT